ncbi:hypothetical protein [Flindersiella endophytica]
MILVESKVKAALEAYAAAQPADTGKVWRGVMESTSRRSPRRAWPAIVVAVAAVVAVGISTVLLRQTEQGQIGGTATPTSTASKTNDAAPTSTPEPLPSATMAAPLTAWPGSPPAWQYVYSVPADLTAAIRKQTSNAFHAGTTWIPVDVLTTTRGQRFVLSGGLATLGTGQEICWQIEPLQPVLATTRYVDDTLCVKPTLPDPSGGSTSDKYWTRPHNLDYYPPIPGDSIIEDERFQFAYGIAAPEVDHVVGVDSDGHRHQGRIVGQGLGWKAQLYAFVAEKSVTFVKFEAYGPTGALLSKMNPECLESCNAPR